jgi:hypothetical protein
MRHIVAALLFLPATALAWTPPANTLIAKKSLQYAPPDLRLLIEKFPREYAAGLEETASGDLRQQIGTLATGTIKMIRSNQPMPLVVERLGLLARLVADANNPLKLDRRLDPVTDDYEHYFERKIVLFPTVFYGIDSNFRLSAYLDRTLARSKTFAPLVAEEYFGDGEEHTSDDFDDRSTAFGIASVSYSHAVTDVVNLYYYIWKEAGGDVRSARTLLHAN